VASVKIEKTQCCIFSADESAEVGKDVETTVSDAYTPSTSHFSGKIDKVMINLK